MTPDGNLNLKKKMKWQIKRLIQQMINICLIYTLPLASFKDIKIVKVTLCIIGFIAFIDP